MHKFHTYLPKESPHKQLSGDHCSEVAATLKIGPKNVGHATVGYLFFGTPPIISWLAAARLSAVRCYHQNNSNNIPQTETTAAATTTTNSNNVGAMKRESQRERETNKCTTPPQKLGADCVSTFQYPHIVHK